MSKRGDGTTAGSPIIGPFLRPCLVQVLDGKRFVVERKAELRRDEREPMPGPTRDLRDSVREPAAILLNLARDIAAAVTRAQRLEAPGRARKRTDGEIDRK